MKKQCKYCKNYFPETDFGVAKTTPKKVYRRHKCRHCYRGTKKQLQWRYRNWLSETKAERGCARCGTTDHRVLDFHHLRDKKFSLALTSRNNAGKDQMEKEIEKCEVICANCHRVLHYEARNNNGA